MDKDSIKGIIQNNIKGKENKEKVNDEYVDKIKGLLEKHREIISNLAEEIHVGIYNTITYEEPISIKGSMLIAYVLLQQQMLAEYQLLNSLGMWTGMCDYYDNYDDFSEYEDDVEYEEEQ